MSSSPLFFPSTPPPRRPPPASYANRPLLSSPLADPSSPAPMPSSPVAEAQARRRAQFKTRSAPQTRASAPAGARMRPMPGLFAQHGSAEPSQKTFLRERFKARCFERARRARDRAVRERRWAESDASSDGVDVDMEVEADEDEDADLDDELFRRIMANERRKKEHEFRLSYEIDVGSSTDPSFEDAGSWEAELKAATAPPVVGAPPDEGPAPPEDLDVDDEELAAWYDEYLHAQEAEDAQGGRPGGYQGAGQEAQWSSMALAPEAARDGWGNQPMDAEMNH